MTRIDQEAQEKNLKELEEHPELITYLKELEEHPELITFSRADEERLEQLITGKDTETSD